MTMYHREIQAELDRELAVKDSATIDSKSILSKSNSRNVLD